MACRRQGLSLKLFILSKLILDILRAECQNVISYWILKLTHTKQPQGDNLINTQERNYPTIKHEKTTQQ